MFTFETLFLWMTDLSILRNVDQEIVIIALKGTEDELKEKRKNI